MNLLSKLKYFNTSDLALRATEIVVSQNWLKAIWVDKKIEDVIDGYLDYLLVSKVCVPFVSNNEVSPMHIRMSFLSNQNRFITLKRRTLPDSATW